MYTLEPLEQTWQEQTQTELWNYKYSSTQGDVPWWKAFMLRQ